MSDGPKCASCQQTLVAGNNVVRITRPDSQQDWAHAGPCRDLVRLPVDQIPGAVIEDGRLAITTTYAMDFEVTRA